MEQAVQGCQPMRTSFLAEKMTMTLRKSSSRVREVREGGMEGGLGMPAHSWEPSLLRYAAARGSLLLCSRLDSVGRMCMVMLYDWYGSDACNFAKALGKGRLVHQQNSPMLTAPFLIASCRCLKAHHLPFASSRLLSR